MKVEKIGWIRKDDHKSDWLFEKSFAWDKTWGITDIFITKDTKSKWLDEDWPPRKVKITIEEIK